MMTKLGPNLFMAILTLALAGCGGGKGAGGEAPRSAAMPVPPAVAPIGGEEPPHPVVAPVPGPAGTPSELPPAPSPVPHVQEVGPAPVSSPGLPPPPSPFPVPEPAGTPSAWPPVPSPVPPVPAVGPAPVSSPSLPPSPSPAPVPEPEESPSPAPAIPKPLPSIPKTLPGRVLAYTNPAPKGFRLEVDPATNHSSHLVLNLVGPRGARVYGVAFFIGLRDDRAEWVQPAGVAEFFRCGRGWNPGLNPPRLARAKVSEGLIEVGMFRRQGPPGILDGTPILSLALEPKKGGPEGKVEWWTPPGKHAVYLDSSRALVDLPIGLGELEVR